MFSTDPTPTGEMIDFLLLAALVAAGFVALLLLAEALDVPGLRTVFSALHARFGWLR